MADDTCNTCGASTTSTGDCKPFTVFCPNCRVFGIVADSLVDPYGDADLSSTGSQWFCDVLECRLPDVDVRTDQCSTVRIYWRNVVAGIRPLDSGGYDVSAGDALAQSDNITFEMSASSECDTEWNAVHCVIEYCLNIISQR